MRHLWRMGLVILLGLAVLSGCGQPARDLRILAGRDRLQPQLAELAAAEPARPVSVIVQTHGDARAAAAAVARLGGAVTSTWELIAGFAADLPAGAVPHLAGTEGVRWVSLDASVDTAAAKGKGAPKIPDAALSASAWQEAVRAERVWAMGITGTGVGVAIVDTGIDESTDLSGQVAARTAIHPDAADAGDGFGHGTHVAGIVAGKGTASGGTYTGVAPGASLINLKISDDAGGATERGLLDALDWVSRHKETHNIRIVNLSTTATVKQGCATSPLCAAVEALWWEGVVVVVAAGNLGDTPDAVHYPPANSPFVITVGAVADQATRRLQDDAMPDWSSRGLTQQGYRKPEVLAPGSRIVSVAAPGSLLVETYPENQVAGSYLMLGGTSMAAPMVSGVAALMLERDPYLTPDQVKWILMNTGRRWGGQGPSDAPIVQADKAVLYSWLHRPALANRGVPRSEGVPAEGDAVQFNALFWTVSPEL